MCGINFILDKQKRLDTSCIIQMNDALKHRGRENTAWHCTLEAGRQVFFGHNRLKIIDLHDNANQPFRSPDGRYVLIFNGEIYNYQSLKQTLKHTYAFSTNSDTEVLMYYLAEWVEKQGKEVIGRTLSSIDTSALHGIFALVWYDTYTQTLIYARDSEGVKPLYKYENEQYLILSSEIRGILASGLVGKVLQKSQIYHYLAYRYAEPTQTFFQDIYPVLPAPKPVLPAPASLSSALTDALSEQILADVPFGIFLSGGVDSTLLLALLQKMGHQNLPAFTIANTAKERDMGTDDFHFARLAAKQFGANLHVIEIDANLLKDLPAFVQSADQPIADGAYWLTQILAKEARKSVKFVLSGAGADELFAGYNRHQAYHFYTKYYPALMLAYPFLKGASWLLPTGYAHFYLKTFKLLKKFGADMTFSKQTTWDNFIKLRTGKQYVHSSIKSDLPFSPLLHDQQNYLQNDILALTDKASMWHELEIRVPYLAPQVVGYAQDLSLPYKLKYGKKWILKQLLTDLGGKVYTQRRKEGFGMPIGKWLREPVGKDFIELLQRPDSALSEYLPTSHIQGIVKQHLAQREDYSTELWALLFLELWLKEF